MAWQAAACMPAHLALLPDVAREQQGCGPLPAAGARPVFRCVPAAAPSCPRQQGEGHKGTVINGARFRCNVSHEAAAVNIPQLAEPVACRRSEDRGRAGMEGEGGRSCVTHACWRSRRECTCAFLWHRRSGQQHRQQQERRPDADASRRPQGEKETAETRLP